jgi:MtaA/CmuA family methyltransferase
MTGNERLLARLRHEPTDSLPLLPITMMFAGDTAGIRYGDYARDARNLAAAQLKTAEKYDFDYVSVISDPARESSDLGASVEWFDDQPPAINESHALLDSPDHLATLPQPDTFLGPRMTDRLEGVRLLHEAVGSQLVVEGWVEGPCALAADLRGVNTLMLDLYDRPSFVEDLFDYVVDMEIAFARRQFDAGATMIGIGDAAASLIGPRFYSQYVQPREQRMIAEIQSLGIPARLHICGNTRRLLAGMGATGAALIDLDYPSPVHEARGAMGPDQVLLGNMDPLRVVHDGTPETIAAALAQCHDEAGRNFIVGAGCEIPRGTPEQNLLALTRYARSHS